MLEEVVFGCYMKKYASNLPFTYCVLYIEGVAKATFQSFQYTDDIVTVILRDPSLSQVNPNIRQGIVFALEELTKDLEKDLPDGKLAVIKLEVKKYAL